ALREDPQISREDRRYTQRQDWRRLIGSAPLGVSAGMFIAGFCLDQQISQLPRVEPGAEVPESTKDELRFFTFYWITALALFLVVLVLAIFDLRATARFGFNQHKQLEQDRRAMLEAEAARIRRRRAEMN